MRIHAIQTGTVAVKKSQQFGSRGEGAFRLARTMLDPEWTKPLPIFAWVIEHPEGLIVIDSGETARASQPGYFPGWHPYYHLGVKAFVEPEEEIGPRLRSLGLSPDDVRWLVMTHLHTDHAGGLHHFPRADILVSRTEYQLAAGFMGRLRGYLPNRWPDWFAPRLVDFEARPVGTFPASFPLTRAGDVHLVPAPGHTAGQLAVILQAGDLSYFFAGDTSYTEQTMLDQVVDGVSLDTRVARQTLQRTRHYVREFPTIYLPSHDPASAGRLAAGQVVARPARQPVPA